jgi:hypothetical protein
MEVSAKLSNAPMSAQKARLVADQIRGLEVEEALNVLKFGICWRPLCTAIVKPSISGEIIDRLDQVLIGFLLLLLTASSTFFCK